ncbi:hypothetical protein OAV47_01935 [bacterium]|nr:hypothetical protein [bacterium]
MDSRITDPEVRILAGISASLEGDYTETENIWEGSPFAWIKTRPSRQVGAIGEKLVAGWLAARGFNVTRSPDSDADRLIEDKRMEIKFSTLWKNGGYKFQQLRDQNYDFALCIGASPFSAHCWVLPKAEILHQWRETGNLASQHGGRTGSDTAWLSVTPEDAPEWLAPFGGTLRHALQLISEQTGFTPDPPNGDEA